MRRDFERHRSLPIRLLLIAAVVGVVLLGACGDDRDQVDAGGSTDATPTEPPDAEPTYSGEITDVVAFEPITEACIDPGTIDADGTTSSDDPPLCTDPATAPLGHLLVETVPGEQTGDKISLRIGRGTPLFRDDDGGRRQIGFDDLAEGDVVDVWVDGPVADSYPQQGSAEAIVVRA